MTAHAPADVLVGTFGPNVIVAHAPAGPLVTVHQFVPEPSGPVVVLPGFDATMMLGVPEACARPVEVPSVS